MKRFLKLYMIEQKLALRSGDMLIFGVAMPVGIMILINVIAGQKQAGEGYTYLESSFASLIAVGICAAATLSTQLCKHSERIYKSQPLPQSKSSLPRITLQFG